VACYFFDTKPLRNIIVEAEAADCRVVVAEVQNWLAALKFSCLCRHYYPLDYS
jgi:hypothetical protein